MAITDHPNYAQLTTLAQELVKKIGNHQADYFVGKGKYFQGIRIPTTVQLDGISSASVGYGLHPSGQDDSWYTFDPLNWNATTKLPCHVKIDVYQAPKGWGWILSIDLWKEGLDPDKYGNKGSHWHFQHNEGPEPRAGIWDDWFVDDAVIPG